MLKNLNRFIRVSVDLSKGSHDRLLLLMDRTGAKSKADVFRDALRVYEWLVQHYAAGGDFLVTDSAGEPRQVVLFGVTPSQDALPSDGRPEATITPIGARARA